MRTLEVRRHSMRDMAGQHLTQAGVDLARRVGSRLGRFERVVTSTLPRAFETAIAMGFAVDEQIEQLAMMSEAVTAIVRWDAGYLSWARAAANSAIVANYTQRQADLWRSIVRGLPENGRALIISHGGIVEAGTIGCVATDPRVADSEPCGYCEGVRLTFDGDKVIDVEILRNS